MELSCLADIHVLNHVRYAMEATDMLSATDLADRACFVGTTVSNLVMKEYVTPVNSVALEVASMDRVNGCVV